MTRQAIEHGPLTELEAESIVDLFARRITNKYRSVGRVTESFWVDICTWLIDNSVIRGRWRGREALQNAEHYFIQECRRRET